MRRYLYKNNSFFFSFFYIYCFLTKILTPVHDILEDQISALIIKGRDARQKLVQTHAQCPPVHSFTCKEQL